MTTYAKISTLVENHFPEFMRTDGPNFVAFLEAYFEWMEQTGYVVDATKNVLSYRMIDTTLDAYIAYFKEELLHTIPLDILADKALLAKHIKQFYRAKGSEKSFKLLFRILYNDDVDFYYPGTDILRASDGKWVINRTIRVVASDTVFGMEGFQIVGGNTDAIAIVERVQKFTSDGVEVMDLFLSNIVGTFVSNEIVTSTNGVSALTTSTVTEASGFYQGTDGFLSWDKYLQDNYYYQEFSYVLKTGTFIDTFRDIVKKVVHPSGTAMFGEVLIISELDSTGATINRETIELVIPVTGRAITADTVGGPIQLGNVFIANGSISEYETLTIAETAVVTIGAFGGFRVPQRLGTLDFTVVLTGGASVSIVSVANTSLELDTTVSRIASLGVMEIADTWGSALANGMIYRTSPVITDSGIVKYAQRTGNVAITLASNTITGNGTLFSSELAVGNTIIIRDTTEAVDSQLFTVSGITSNTIMSVLNPASNTIAVGTLWESI